MLADTSWCGYGPRRSFELGRRGASSLVISHPNCVRAMYDEWLAVAEQSVSHGWGAAATLRVAGESSTSGPPR